MAQSDRAVPFLLVAPEGMPVEDRRAGTEERRVWRNHALGQAGDRHENFERRARRVPPLNQPVLQRQARIALQRGPGRRVDAAGKGVGIERRLARHREHFARARIQEHRRAGEVVGLERLFERPLQIEIDRDLQALPLDGRGLAQDLDFAAVAGDDHVLLTVAAHQARVVDALDARLADDRAGRQILKLGPRELRLGDLAHVAEQMRRQRPGQVRPRRLELHLRFGQLQRARFHRRDLAFGGVLDDDDRTEERVAPAALNDVADVGRFHADGLGQALDGRRQIGAAFPQDGNRGGRAVVHEQPSVAIVNGAARRPERNGADVVVVRHLAIAPVRHHLEHPERDGEDRERGAGGNLQPGQPAVEDVFVFGGAGMEHAALTIVSG